MIDNHFYTTELVTALRSLDCAWDDFSCVLTGGGMAGGGSAATSHTPISYILCHPERSRGIFPIITVSFASVMYYLHSSFAGVRLQGAPYSCVDGMPYKHAPASHPFKLPLYSNTMTLLPVPSLLCPLIKYIPAGRSVRSSGCFAI